MKTYKYNLKNKERQEISIEFERADIPAIMAVREALSQLAKDVIDSRTNFGYLEELGEAMAIIEMAITEFGKEEDDEQREPDGAID